MQREPRHQKQVGPALLTSEAECRLEFGDGARIGAGDNAKATMPALVGSEGAEPLRILTR
ncbi:hypothetical protein BST26_15420 [Mycolicibacterium insubricum]|uniref:Uncharacterized protein n=1 Tax=Mycolicibacterium insubricum TaxID=444597 RepID=A0A1X0D5K6_9MYCO|nr:hypothetical protein BST26_15420 [Mycolicibacterium insubricum]